MHTHTPSKVISEIFRVLKPVVKVGYMFMVQMDLWNVIYKLRKI